MNPLILMLALLSQEPDFSMFGEVKRTVTVVKETVRTVEVPIHYMTDNSGKEWFDKDKEVLRAWIRKQNTARSVQIGVPVYVERLENSFSGSSIECEGGARPSSYSPYTALGATCAGGSCSTPSMGYSSPRFYSGSSAGCSTGNCSR